ncbi:hypothetical protein MMC14_003472 [Varicellaria rhodocarpa]|nr:hypothetical protein [Varicellaria rhodocarpa]
MSSQDPPATSISQDTDEIKIPAVLESKETYEFLGFDDNIAQILWDLYVNKPADLEADFFSFVTWHFEQHSTDATSGLDDWDEFMIDFGINRKLRLAILLSEFSDICYTATCKFWLLEAMEMKWAALQDLDSSLRMEQMRI